ncbi:alpha-E domain-containing protein [Dermacoccaceae bacterium W4C1]
MLSRIAEALFWIGRYIERAECTARVLDVNLQLLVEDPTIDQDASCRSLLASMGVDHEGVATRQTVLDLLLSNSQSPASVAWALASARESARRSREVVSTDMWEAINTTYNQVSFDKLSQRHPADAFRMVRERANLITALCDNTLSHDSGWQFLVLGRSIERVDMTARLMLARPYSGGADAGWQVTLRSCGAGHAFTRTYRAIESPRSAAEFLLLDRLFPRSVVFGLTQAENCLEWLDPRQARLGFGGDAARIVGRARAGLEIRTLTDLLADLPAEMLALQQVCADATDAVSRRYFEGAVAPEWLGD